MGGGSWDSDAYTTATASRVASGTPDFEHDSDIKSGKASGIHETLDPLKMTDGRRESRDSDEHPESLPVIVLFDVTGSMGMIPTVLQKKLTSVMDTIIEKAGLVDTQILVGAIGDAFCDRYPFQVGQFESDNSFDEQLRNIILERGGGGGAKESYELAYRFAADHTVTDSFEKRGKKGYLFTMGDEAPYAALDAGQVSRIFGVDVTQDESIESALERAQEKWEVYHLFSMDGSYPRAGEIHDTWRKLLGERFIMVEDSSLVAEVISGIIHMMESTSDVDKVVADIGLTGRDGDVVKNALVPLEASLVSSSEGVGALPVAHTG